MARCCEHGNELLGSIKDVFLDRLSDFSFSRKTLLHMVSQSVSQ
jgi:hypothetical protein